MSIQSHYWTHMTTNESKDYEEFRLLLSILNSFYNSPHLNNSKSEKVEMHSLKKLQNLNVCVWPSSFASKLKSIRANPLWLWIDLVLILNWNQTDLRKNEWLNYFDLLDENNLNSSFVFELNEGFLKSDVNIETLKW